MRCELDDEISFIEAPSVIADRNAEEASSAHEVQANKLYLKLDGSITQKASFPTTS